VALDTNILAYAEGIEEEDDRTRAALSLVQGLPSDAVVIPVQALGELYNVLVRKAGIPRSDARDAILTWTVSYAVSSASAGTLLAAVDLATTHQLTIWDAIIVATAADAGCRLLLSEDMHDGFAWGGVTVVNPFASSRHPLLAALLKQSTG
jgi:predicted nucleic acid-binding protein